LQGHEDVRKTGKKRGCKHEKHDRAVHRKELVVLLFRRHDLEAWRKELRPDDQRHDAANQKIRERGNEIEVADFLVVGGRQPIHENIALTRYAGVGEPWGRLCYGGTGSRLGHLLFPFNCGCCSGQILENVELGPEATDVALDAEARDVSVVLCLRHDVDLKQHQRVVLTAELRALSTEHTLFLRDEIPVVGSGGNHVFLVKEINNPERVDDIAGFNFDFDFLIYGKIQLG